MKGIYLSYNSTVKTGKTLDISMRIANEYGYISGVKALFNRHGQKPGEEAVCSLVYDDSESDEKYSTFKGKIKLKALGYHTFYITLEVNGVEKSIKCSGKENIPVFDEGQENLKFWECFLYLNSFKTPDRIKGGTMYQILIDTFCCKDPPESVRNKFVPWNTFPKWQPDADGVYRNDQYYGGNFKGIISKLPYIKSLGVTIIYLTPVFKGSSSNRYDIVDFEQIDEMIGTWDEFAELKRKANALGIDIVLDVVFNHASYENVLAKTSPCLFTGENWWGFKNLIVFDKSNPKYYELIEKWIKLYSNYVDGLRLDVADELPDHVLRFIRKVAKKYGLYILGEVWKNAVTGDFRGFLYGDELDGVMNYQFANAIYRLVRWKNFDYFSNVVNSIKALYPPEALDVSPIFLSSHDTPRVLNILGGPFMKGDPKYENTWDMEKDPRWYTNGEFDTYKFRKWEVENDRLIGERLLLAKKKLKVATFFQYTLPGLPSTFAGDEFGMMGYKDPMNRKSVDWDNRDYELLNNQIMLGQFRNSYREIFADSTNCTEPELLEGQNIVQFKRENINCKFDWTNLKCSAEINGKTELIVA